MRKRRFLMTSKKLGKSIPKYNPEEQLFINPRRYRFRKNKKCSQNLILILISLLLLPIIFLSIKLLKYLKYQKNKNKPKFFVYNTDTIKDANFSIYKDMLPHLKPNSNDIPKSIPEIFNAREIYISDVKITNDYIRYLRPIDEEYEKQYQKRYSENETAIDSNLYKRREDQYDYLTFSKLALNEQLIENDNKEIEYDNNPIISVVIPSYNKYDLILKSVRSIQNQNFKNIEIIIVNDCSTDNSSSIFNYLLKTDPRIRIFHHTTNLGCWRSRLDGILYSRGQYVILFDAGDLYEDNYVLLDAYNIIVKYNLDSCKFLFRIIRSFENLTDSIVYFHVRSNDKIVYGYDNIKRNNIRIFTSWGNIWNRLVRANIYTKSFLLLNDLILNLHKNTWDDSWFNEIVHKVSFSFAVYERSGYVYLQDWKGEGSPKSNTDEQKSKFAKEFVGFLYYNYNFCGNNSDCKIKIIDKLREYDQSFNRFRLYHFKAHFEVLNNLLEALSKDPDVPEQHRKYCEKLLNDSIKREKEMNDNISK